MPNGLIIEEQPRNINIGNGLVDGEQVHRRFIRYRDIADGETDFFALDNSTPAAPPSLIIYPYNDGGFFPS